MPVYLTSGGLGTGGRGGGGLHFRDPVDVFADAAARTTAFSTGGTLAGQHVQFAADRTLAIVIGTIASPTNFQTYTGDSGTYDDTLWLNRTDAVQGRTGRAGAPGGGALQHLHTYNDDEITAAEDDLFIDMGFDWPTDIQWMTYTLRGRSYWLNLYPILGDPADASDTGITASTAGTASTDATRVQALEPFGGNIYFGKTTAGRALVEFSQAHPDGANLAWFRYEPSRVQGLNAAAVQALIDATPLSNLQGQVTDGQVPAAIARDAEIGPAITAYAGAIAGLTLTEGQIPASIMRDAEFTAAAVRGLLGLTAAEANDLLTGASITNRVLSFPQNDGTTATITLPADANTQDGVVASGAFNAGATALVLTLDTGGTVSIPVPASLRMGGGGGVTEMRVNELIAAALAAAVTGNTETGITVEYNAADGTLDFVVTGSGPTPHSLTRYAALRADGAMPGDFTEANFLAGTATSSMTQDIDTPASATDMVVGIAVPSSEGVLTAVAELDANGMVNQFANMIRGDFLPALGGTEVTLDIDGEEHYVYCTNSTVLAIFLGSIGYRLTQTTP